MVMEVRQTKSLCPACYEEIAADVFVKDHVWMVKKCPVHGEYVDMVERDPEWYKICQGLSCKTIYSGYLMDVTGKCNLRCRYCYHDNNGRDRLVRDIVADAQENLDRAPFFLTGGEPTEHPGLPKVVNVLSSMAETWVLSNGVNLCNQDYLFELCLNGLLFGNILLVGLSFHKESQCKDIEFLELCRSKGLIVGTSFYVIDALDQINDALAIFREYRGVLRNMRIKAASNLWCEQDVTKKDRIYTSDMIGYLNTKGSTELLGSDSINNKLSYANVMHDGMHLILVSWYDVGNVDLDDIECPPFYRAMDGKVYDFVKSSLVNEGIVKIGKAYIRQGTEQDIEAVSALWESLVLETVPDSRPDVEEWKRITYQSMENPQFHLFIAEKSGEIIGFQDGMAYRDPCISEVCVMGRHFYVKPGYRSGSTVGAQLHRAGIKQGKKYGATRFRSMVGRDSMIPWIKKGYVPTETLMEVMR
jgi:hypothetical protein